MSFEEDYLKLLAKVIDHGWLVETRAGSAYSLIGQTLTIPFTRPDVFPLLTTRQIFYRPVFGELAAFLTGSERLRTFKTFGCNYWDENAKAWAYNKGTSEENMRVGRIYGAQWREWRPGYIDQLAALVAGIRRDPYGRRYIVTAWAPHELQGMCLPPCHILFQAHVRPSRHGSPFLCLSIYMRSVDLCLGLPSDIVLYAALLKLLCNELCMQPGALYFHFGDAHVYANHVDNAKLQLARTPQPLPSVVLRPGVMLKDFTPTDIAICDYNPLERINYEFNV